MITAHRLRKLAARTTNVEAASALYDAASQIDILDARLGDIGWMRERVREADAGADGIGALAIREVFALPMQPAPVTAGPATKDGPR